MEKLPAHGWMVYPTSMIRGISMAPGCVGKIGGETINCNDTNEDQKGECDKDNTQRLSGDARDMADMFLMRAEVVMMMVYDGVCDECDWFVFLCLFHDQFHCCVCVCCPCWLPSKILKYTICLFNIAMENHHFLQVNHSKPSINGPSIPWLC